MFKSSFTKRARLLLILTALLLVNLPASAQTDNCCSVDRQCATNDEWVSGYYAFRNSECGVPSQQQQAHQARQDQTPTHSNNCCFVGWLCDAQQEWISGYFAFQRDQCVSQSRAQVQGQRWQSGEQQWGNANQQGSASNQQG